jgi:hypothetical protein
MTKPTITGLSLLWGVLLGATVLALLTATEAVANVGVISVAEGEPLGKPPAEAERILRLGIDVQTGETITTQANDRTHVVFLDGTSLTVGPNARLVIDKFVYDPNTKTGEMSLNAALRLWLGGS